MTLLGAIVAIVGAGLCVSSAEMTMRAVGGAAVVGGVLVMLFNRGGGGSDDANTILTEQDVAVIRAQLTTVTQQAQRIAQGEPMDAEAENDALAALHVVAEKVQTMASARVHIVATERDLEQARRMYRQILPLSSAAEHGAVSLAGSCSPAAETGGDWWTYRKLSGGRILLVIGDATGHGVHSAMIGCMAHGAVRALTQMGDDFLQPRRVLDAVNTAIRVPGIEHASMTLFTALIDANAATVNYFNHGHVFPLIAIRDATGTITEVTSITGERDIDEDEFSGDTSVELDIRSGTAKMAPGSVLVCFTDGLIERAKSGGRQFGARRLQQALVGAQVPPGVAGLTQLRDRLIKRVDEYVEHAPLEDDITLVLLSLGTPS